MITRHNPSTIAAPLGTYSHGVEVPPDARRLYIAGQVAIDVNGVCPEGFEAQAELVWKNIIAVLESAHMGVEDLVKITAYIVGQENFPTYSAVRKRMLGNVWPASTAIMVPALVKSEWLVEVDAVAAKVERK
jgi:enamine deaminase RidA (YjgF/YER057c/UK114 family)